MEEIKSTEKVVGITDENVDTVLKSMETSDKIDKLSVVSDNLNEQKDIMYSYVDCEDMAFIDERLEEYTLEELEEKIKDDDFVRKMFTPPNSDIEAGITDKANQDGSFTEEDELNFKRELLIHAKKTNQTYAEIDKYIADMEKARDEFNAEAQEIIGSMENNIVTVVDMMKEGLKDITDERELKRRKTIIKYIESGWTFDIINEILDKYPNVPKNLLRDMHNDTMIKNISDRYMKKLRDNKCNISLNHFVSAPTVKRKSIEMTLLNPDQYDKSHEDLFIFMLIRFFAMADWHNKDIGRAHTSISVSLKRAMANEYPEDMQKLVVDNIAKMVARIEEAVKA